MNITDTYFIKLVSSETISDKPYHTQIKCQVFFFGQKVRGVNCKPISD